MRLAVLRPTARSLMAGAPPQRSMSWLDCQPPWLEWCVLGWDFSRCSITLRSSALSAAASGTSKMTSGVAKRGTICGALLLGYLYPTGDGRIEWLGVQFFTRLLKIFS